MPSCLKAHSPERHQGMFRCYTRTSWFFVKAAVLFAIFVFVLYYERWSICAAIDGCGPAPNNTQTLLDLVRDYFSNQNATEEEGL